MTLRQEFLALDPEGLYLKDMGVKFSSYSAFLDQMEAEDNRATLVALQEYKDSEDYSACRASAYAQLDDMLKEALVERELGSSTRWDEYAALRAAIKERHPKPL